MALLPCAFGPHRNLGRNIAVYLGLVRGQAANRHSWRVCLRHWQEIHVGLAKFEVNSESGALSTATDESFCLTCGEPVDESGWQLFVTAYPAQDQREDYWTKLHDGCSLPESWPSPTEAR